MAEYQLHCFGESGNAYKVALLLELTGADWEPLFVDFFDGATRTPEFRSEVNELGEVPVLIHGTRKLSQSGVILTYLADRLGQFGPGSEDEGLEILRWLFFDNHKFTSFFATLRFQQHFMKVGQTPVTDFLLGRVQGAFDIVDKHLATTDFILGKQPTIADLSMCGYLFYKDEVALDWLRWPSLVRWTERVAGLPRWKGPYDLMPRSHKG